MNSKLSAPLSRAALSLSALILPAIAEKPAPSAEPTQQLEEFVVTATREPEPLKETPASISVVTGDSVKLAAPAHPQQILGQVPGVSISVTNGEGHTTSIRQPFTTSPLYLFLEDGIPVRPTGFFNHNSLYEVNIPMAGGIEVTRGPGSALYGSDAIGGIVNVLTKSSGPTPSGSLSAEIGSFGWLRGLASLSSGDTRLGAFHGDLNLTHTDGWRDATGYDRRSGNFRWDWHLDDDTRIKTIVGFTNIDQQTGANSPLPQPLYLSRPTINLLSPAYRKVQALRISSEFEKRFGDGLLVLTPYFRDNQMDLNGSYNFSSDPRMEKTQSYSIGLLSKWRQDFPEFLRSRIILGLDLESSPGKRTEDALNFSVAGVNAFKKDIRTGALSTTAGAYTNYAGYTVGNRIYDYDVTFRSASPYLHTEISPLEKLRVTVGARYDLLKYEFENNISSSVSSNNGTSFGQAASNSKSFHRLSPKLGATYELTPNHSIYGSYNQGFRIPSESQLFRGGGNANPTIARSRAENALLLKPMKADEFELGVRGKLAEFDYTLAAYALRKRDDLVLQRDPITNASISQNAGKTESRGLEISIARNLLKSLKLESALSYSKHEYRQWKGKDTSGNTFDYAGNEMAAAPRFVGNTRLTWTPSEAVTAQLEWVRIGSYFLQDSNNGSTSGVDQGVSKYNGHHLFNFRASYQICKGASIFGRVMNIADTRYADSAQVSSGTAVYAPGLPRTFYGGMEIHW